MSGEWGSIGVCVKEKGERERCVKGAIGGVLWNGEREAREGNDRQESSKCVWAK